MAVITITITPTVLAKIIAATAAAHKENDSEMTEEFALRGQRPIDHAVPSLFFGSDGYLPSWWNDDIGETPIIATAAGRDRWQLEAPWTIKSWAVTSRLIDCGATITAAGRYGSAVLRRGENGKLEWSQVKLTTLGIKTQKGLEEGWAMATPTRPYIPSADERAFSRWWGRPAGGPPSLPVEGAAFTPGMSPRFRSNPVDDWIPATTR